MPGTTCFAERCGPIDADAMPGRVAAAGRTCRVAGAIVGFLLSWPVVLSWPTPAAAEEGCAPAIATAQHDNERLPAHILHAIGVVESGRRDFLTGRLAAWPWSVNAAGDSRVFASSDQAIAFVRDAQARGIRSIDVGCMQINLMYHPNAFASLEEAFRPEANVRYATAFLLDLQQRTGDWATATGNYHSATPGLSEEYARRVGAVLSGEISKRDAAESGSLAASWSRSAVFSGPGMPSSAGTFPPYRTAAASYLPPIALGGAAVRRILVIEPGTVPAVSRGLRAAGFLPHVYHP